MRWTPLQVLSLVFLTPPFRPLIPLLLEYSSLFQDANYSPKFGAVSVFSPHRWKTNDEATGNLMKNSPNQFSPLFLQEKRKIKKRKKMSEKLSHANYATDRGSLAVYSSPFFKINGTDSLNRISERVFEWRSFNRGESLFFLFICLSIYKMNKLEFY